MVRGGQKKNVSDRSRIGLVLAGGGARGAYQVGVLKAIAELRRDEANPFSIITGVSVGAINAVALASRADNFKRSVEWLERIWSNLNAHDIYHTDAASICLGGIHWLVTIALGGLGVSNPSALLNAKPLGKLLEREIKFDSVKAAIESGALDALAVTASSYANGRARTFYQGKIDLEGWSRARREGVSAVINIDHILASTALPFIFHTRRIDGEYFGDGGLRLTDPLSPAIRLGASKILVIGNRDESRDEPCAVVKPPNFGEIFGYLLDILFNDNLDADIERIERINEILSILPVDKCHLTPLRQIGVHAIRPSQDVREITGKYVAELPWTIKLLLRSIGAWGPNWRIASYLLFERSYCRALIDLGYQDAMAQSDDLCTFFEIC